MSGARAAFERPQCHMHGNLIDGILKGAPNWGPLLMVQSDEKLFE